MMKYLSVLLLAALLLGLCGGCSEKKPVSEPDVSLFDVVCSADEALERAKAAGIPVMEDHHCTAGQDTWDAFYETVSAGKPSQVLCAMYYTLDPSTMTAEAYEMEKDSYPRLFFYLVTYDGKTYTVKTRLSSEAEPDDEDSFSLLLHFTGEAPTPDATYSTFDAYVLADDPGVTPEGIWAGLISSQAYAGYHHCYVFIDNRD